MIKRKANDLIIYVVKWSVLDRVYRNYLILLRASNIDVYKNLWLNKAPFTIGARSEATK